MPIHDNRREAGENHLLSALWRQSWLSGGFGFLRSADPLGLLLHFALVVWSGGLERRIITAIVVTPHRAGRAHHPFAVQAQAVVDVARQDPTRQQLRLPVLRTRQEILHVSRHSRDDPAIHD